MRTQLYDIPGGDWGTRATVRRMGKLANKGAINPKVRRLALQITRGISGRNSWGQAMAIRRYLFHAIAFTKDPHGAELLYAPELMVKILTTGQLPLRVDCDDAAVLAASIGKSIGLRARLVVVGFHSPKAPMRHIFTELAGTGPASRWYEMDVTRSQQFLPLQAAISRQWIVGV